MSNLMLLSIIEDILHLLKCEKSGLLVRKHHKHCRIRCILAIGVDKQSLTLRMEIYNTIGIQQTIAIADIVLRHLKRHVAHIVESCHDGLTYKRRSDGLVNFFRVRSLRVHMLRILSEDQLSSIVLLLLVLL
jgi:hypothetical protein